MEKYAITLEQAKKLKELGASEKFAHIFSKQFYWYESPIRTAFEDMKDFIEDFVPGDDETSNWYPAYSVGELGEILPYKVWGHGLVLRKEPDGTWFAGYYDQCDLESDSITGIQYGQTEAQARGQLLIYLLENKLL